MTVHYPAFNQSFRHLLESSAKYAVQFGGIAELYESARIHHNSAADVVICSYELAENVSVSAVINSAAAFTMTY